MSEASLRQRLSHLTPAQAAVQARLAAALGARGLTVTPRAARRPSGWILCDAGGDARVALSPLTANGAPLGLDADGRLDAGRAALALEAVEPLVAAAEQALGALLRPVELVGAVGPGTMLRIEGDRAAMLLALDASSAAALDAGVPTSPAPAPPARVAAVPVPWQLLCAGPALPVPRLAKLRPGDLLLLGGGGLDSRVRAGGLGWSARFDPRTRLVTVVKAYWEECDGMASASGDSAPDWSAAQVPVEVVIQGGNLLVGELARLAPSGVLRLDPATAHGDTLPVELRAGGLRLGRGELVVVGDGYGVVITGVDAPPVAPSIEGT